MQSRRRRNVRAARSIRAAIESLELRRLLSVVDLDPTFGGDGRVLTKLGNASPTVAAAVQADGKLLVAGTVLSNGVNTDAVVIRYNANGTLDSGFGTGGV